MSVWGKLIGGVAGFALGGPIGAILGTVFGHAVDRSRQRKPGGWPNGSLQSKQAAFTIAVIVLNAKMAKADGQVTRDEVETFKRIFDIPADEMGEVGKLFDEARREAEGFEPYARQIGDMFAHDRAVLENLLGGLFQVALADGVMHPNEMQFLEKVAREFRLDAAAFERIRSSFMAGSDSDPYAVLGLKRDASDADVKSTYRQLIRENHPDTLIAKGMPQEFIDVANDKMAAINAAYDLIETERNLK